MSKRGAWLIGAIIVAFATPGAALAEDRDYCPDRPGLGTEACTIEPWRVSVETGLADWSRSDDSQSRTDTVLIGDTLVRVGVTGGTELIAGWTPYGFERTRDKVSGAVMTSAGVGDITLGAKVNLHHPGGDGFSIALQPFVTAPVGRAPIGAGDWGAGLVVPATYDLGHGLSAAFTGEVDAAVNGDGNGRHLAYSGVWGLGVALTKAINGTVEFEAARDEDPAGHSTATYASLSFAWLRHNRLQVDIGGVVGLDHAADDAEIYAGISRRF